MAIIFIGIFFYYSDNDIQTTEYKRVNIQTKEIPQDEIHKKFAAQNSAAPSKENVNKSMIDKIRNLEHELNNGSKDTVKMLELANFLVAGHQPEKGILYYNKILKINPKRDDVLLQLAIVYANQHKYSDAIIVTKKMLKNKPENQIALYNLGALNATMGEEEKAKTIWQSIVKKYPNSQMANKAKQSLKRLK